MAIHTTDAIILRQYAYRETSVLVSCLTDRYGKIKGVVKGLRGPGNRFRSAMEPLTLNRLVFYDSRNSPLCLISQCELLGPFQGLTRELESIWLAALCAELVDVLLEPGEPQPGIFTLLHETLRAIVERRCSLLEIRVHFVSRLLQLVGFQPQLDECAACGRHPQAAEAYWSVRQGGLLCGACLHEDPRADAIRPHLLEALAACRESPEPMALDGEEAALMRRHLDEFLSWRIDRPLKTLGGARQRRVPVRRRASAPREVAVA